MFAFLKRMVGQDPDAEETQRKFESSLSRLGNHSEGLKGVADALNAVIQDVERKNEAIALSRTVSGMSGEHRVSLPSNPELEDASHEH